MEKLFILLALAVTSCVTSNQEKDIRVYYQDGTVEELTISTEDGYTNQFGDKEATVYFNNGCLYTDHHESKYEANFTGCIRCGVKDYEVLDVRTLKEKE
jgi:hypothetical protein